MTDLKKKHHPIGSLTSRILIISVLLLVIPLFLQTLFLYREEYKEKLTDMEEDLRVLAKERVHLIEEIIRLNWALLDFSRDQRGATPNNGAFFGGPGDNVKPQYTTPKNGAFFGGPDGNVKPLYIEKIPLPQGVGEHFVLINSSRDAIIVGRKESNSSAAVISIPMAQITKDLGTSVPIRVDLVPAKTSVKPDTLEVIEPIPGMQYALELTVSKKFLKSMHLSDYYFRFMTLLFFVGGVGGGAVYFFTRRISRPLRDLCKTMERVSEGAVHARYKPDKMGFEVNELGLQFNETLDHLLRHAQEAERERIARGKLAEELRIGHDIQASLFPTHIGFSGVDIGASYAAAKEVNGDFCDFFRLENGKLLLVICDSAGKGVSGCLYSLGLRSMIRSLATVVPSLSEIVQRTNNLFWLDAHESSMFSTLWFGLFDPTSNLLTYCSQGHPPAILRREGEVEELWTDGLALGAQQLDVITTKEISLMKGDLLVLYTDGIIEAHDPDHQLFGKSRLIEFILRKKQETASQMAEQLIEEVHLFSNGTAQHDDMSVLVIYRS